MLQQQTSKGSRNAISSPELADGHSHYASQASQTTLLAGQEARHASHLVQQENNSVNSMSDISHQLSCGLSLSATLQSSLANKLRQRLESTGSMIYSMSWKEKITPAGRLYCQRQASVPRTSVTGFILVRSAWPSPCAQNGMVNGYTDWLKVIRRKEAGRQQNLQDVVILAAWPTPTANDFKGSGKTVIRKDGKDRTFDRLDYATEQGLAPWPTVTTIDNNQVAGMGAAAMHPARGTTLGGAARLATWATPRAVDGSKGSRSFQGCQKEMERKGKLDDLPSQATYLTCAIRITASGKMLTGLDAGMGDSGRLNPAHSRWLMGFPPEWDVCAATVTR